MTHGERFCEPSFLGGSVRQRRSSSRIWPPKAPAQRHALSEKRHEPGWPMMRMEQNRPSVWFCGVSPMVQPASRQDDSSFLGSHDRSCLRRSHFMSTTTVAPGGASCTASKMLSQDASTAPIPENLAATRALSASSVTTKTLGAGRSARPIAAGGQMWRPYLPRTLPISDERWLRATKFHVASATLGALGAFGYGSVLAP
mmetsp:Transcript_19202/g.57035  ORF Transcript_19202/g.57035 Transcript_19202/m.57035 type:complete len:200 (-) Transcript_19202:379-978(-)